MYPTNIKTTKKDKRKVKKAVRGAIKAGIKENVKLFLKTKKFGRIILAKFHIKLANNKIKNTPFGVFFIALRT